MPAPPCCRRSRRPLGRPWRRCLGIALLVGVIAATAWLASTELGRSASSQPRRSSDKSSSLSSFLLALGGGGGGGGDRESNLGPAWWAERGPAAGFAAWGGRRSMEDRFTIGARVFAAPGDDYGDGELGGGGGGGDSTDGGDEDSHGAGNGTTTIYGVFDGHGGQNAVDFVSKTLPRRLQAALTGASRGDMDDAALREILSREIQSTDEALLRHLDAIGGDDSGSTCVVAVVVPGWLAVASVGDSRAVLCDRDGRAVPLTEDHKPYLAAERRRIQRAGGFIRLSGVWRVQGELAMSRALGDARLKRLGVITARPGSAAVPLSARPLFLLVASDGLWDALGNQEAVDLALRHRGRPLDGARALAAEALRRGSLDNVSVMVVSLLR